MDKGYQLFLQPVGTAFYSDLDLLRLVERVNRLRPFAFYIVDTLGSMYPAQLTRQFHLIDENLEPSVRLGFHGHNNLQLAFSNAQTPLLHADKAERGAGFLCLRHGPGRRQPAHRADHPYINRNIQSRYSPAMVLDIYESISPPFEKSTSGATPWPITSRRFTPAIPITPPISSTSRP